MKRRKAFRAITTIVALSISVACGERPDTVAHADYPAEYTFETLPQLVRKSDLVVLGTVESAARGHSMGGGLYSRDLTVRVEKHYYGVAVGARIVVDQEGYDALDGTDASYELDSQPWVYPGDRAVFFLETGDSDLTPEGHFILLPGPGQLVVNEDGKVSTPADDPIARQLNGSSWSTVEGEIEAAVEFVGRENERTPEG
jgi:hypothetical protein